MQHIPHHPQSCSVQKRNTTYFFVSFPEKRTYFDFRVNYLDSEVEWPIKTEFVIENVNLYEKQKQTCEPVNLNYCKS